jgi:hypothetical protein
MSNRTFYHFKWRFGIMLECELLETCGLFRKYQATDGLACEWFIGHYCVEPGITDCKRRRHYLLHGTSPSDDMLPTGVMIAAATESEQLLVLS